MQNSRTALFIFVLLTNYVFGQESVCNCKPERFPNCLVPLGEEGPGLCRSYECEGWICADDGLDRCVIETAAFPVLNESRSTDNLFGCDIQYVQYAIPNAPELTPSQVGVETVDPTNWIRECVTPYKADNFSNYVISYSNFFLIQKRHGMCMGALSCVFEKCEWSQSGQDALLNEDLSSITFEEVSDKLPTPNFPGAAGFPQSVLELVQMVKYAIQEKLKISVKTSGHSYTGSSTMKGSLQINLRNFPTYSSSSIFQCEEAPSSYDMACKLAEARNKTAVVRVGGGELWSTVYKAVTNWNRGTGVLRNVFYEIVGGAAGSVASAGGWLQGGGEGVGMERLYGFGVDNVLALEMVLADATHVKFGPTKWNQVDGQMYPQTVEVQGYCNSKVSTRESEWIWDVCRNDIPFNDLWFAVRGGGGGTYGIVTAVYYQLHEASEGLAFYQINITSAITLLQVLQTPSQIQKFEELWFDFMIDALFNPTNVGLSDDTSNQLWSPGLTLALDPSDGFTFLLVRQSVQLIFENAWRNYSQRVIAEALPAVADFVSSVQTLITATIVKGSYQEIVLAFYASDTSLALGEVPDDPQPGIYPSSYVTWSVLVPKEFLLQKNDDVYYFLRHLLRFAHLIGGKTAISSDNMNAVPLSQRMSGFQAAIGSRDEISRFRPIFNQYFMSNSVEYLGDTEYNHLSPTLPPPVIGNFSQFCDENENAGQQCFTIPQTVWGVALSARLEEIKRVVDPSNIFNCYHCIGFTGY